MTSGSRLERLTIRELVIELSRTEIPLGDAARPARAALHEQAIIAELHRRGADRASRPATENVARIPFPEGHP